MLCTFHDLCITNSFPTKPQHKVSWRHPRSKLWHQLDLILVRRTAIKNALHTPQCGLRYRPLLGVLSDQDAVKEIPPHKDKREHSCWCQQDVLTRPHGAVHSDLREGIWRPVTRWLCHREVGSSAWHCVRHCCGYLWEEVLKITWLVRSQINCDDNRHWSQESCPRRVQRAPSERNLQNLRFARSGLLGAAQTNTGQNSATTSSPPP